MAEPLKWYDEKRARPGSRRSLRCIIGQCVRCYCSALLAITVAIDQYVEKALGNREYFLNQALQHWWWQEGSRPLIVRDS